MTKWKKRIWYMIIFYLDISKNDLFEICFRRCFGTYIKYHARMNYVYSGDPIASSY